MCTLPDGKVYKCNQAIYMVGRNKVCLLHTVICKVRRHHCAAFLQVENGNLRYYSWETYTSWGNPKPDISAVGDCGPGSVMHGCPAGPAMPANPLKLCSGATPSTPCKELQSDPAKCCACRKTKAAGTTAAYASVAAVTEYSLAPDCNQPLTPLPVNTKVAYTGAKLLSYTNADKGCTTARDYALLVVQVGQNVISWQQASPGVRSLTSTCNCSQVRCGRHGEGGAQTYCNPNQLLRVDQGD